MNLPDYFLADLPPGASVTPTLLTEAGQTLRRNREQFLVSRTTDEIVQLLVKVAGGWLEPENRFRRLALEQGPAQTGFGRVTLERGLDDFFREVTRENLHALLVQDLGDARALDEFVPSPGVRTRARAMGPQFLAHVAAGNLPNPAFMSLVLGLLTRSAQLLKCASGAAFLPRLFAHSIYDADHKLGACLEIAEWRGGNVALEAALFAQADCVTATGSDEALAGLRGRLPATVRFLGYGHRVSFGFVAGGALARTTPETLVARAAEDVVAWDQAGCLSPQVIYVEEGRGLGAIQFAEGLAAELARREATQPRGMVSMELAATIASRRAFYTVRAAHSGDTRLWQSADSTAWTVVGETDPRFQSSCGGRWIYVKPVKDLTVALQGADAVRGQVSCVGLAAPEERVAELVRQLADWGVTRVCPLGRMQRPPLTWRHDGRLALGDLVTWTDWE